MKKRSCALKEVRLAFAMLALATTGSLKAGNVTNVTESGECIVRFSDVGSFSWTAPCDITNAQLLVVGGGGGGGKGTASGGGGGGGVIHLTDLQFFKGQAYSVTVGAGGADGKPATNGGESVFGAYRAPGGGAGAASETAGSSGANGGGACSGDPGTAGTGQTEWILAAGYYGGYDGGSRRQRTDWLGTGGGGAMGAGESITPALVTAKTAGKGGDGYACDITGSTVYYGCGGGGGINGTDKTAGQGGSDGASGGRGADATAATEGTANTGTGGGGGAYTTVTKNGAKGGSGVVVLRYASPMPIATVTGFSGFLDNTAHGVTVNVIYPSSGATINYAEDGSEDWQTEPLAYGTKGTHTIRVKVSAQGLADYITSAMVNLYDEPPVKDGSVCLVCPAGTEGNTPAEPYGTWATAATNIAAAVSMVNTGGTVFVAPGSYKLAATISIGKRCTVRSFRRDTGADDPGNTLLDGQGACRCLDLTAASASVPVTVCGLTFVNGCEANGTGGGVNIYSYTSAEIPTQPGQCAALVNCIFTNNVAKGAGGALFVRGRVYLKECVFRGNRCTNGNWGNTMEILPVSGATQSASALLGCTFEEYEATGVSLLLQGYPYRVSDCTFRTKGAKTIAFYNSTVNATNTIIVNSTCLNAPGPFVAPYSSDQSQAGVTIRNCLIVGGAGNGFVCGYTNATSVVENCTIVGKGGAGIVVPAGTESASNKLTVVNSIVYGNNGTGADVNVGEHVDYVVTTSSTGYGLAGNHNTVDPKFKDAANGDYSLKPSSPHRDAGTLLNWMTAEAYDLAGLPRVVKYSKTSAEDPSALPDFGCYEIQDGRRGIVISVR